MTELIATVGVWSVAFLHLWFCVLEMYFWQKPVGLKTFKLNKDIARVTAPLAMNQGVYNAFLSAGLFWGIFSSDALFSFQIKVFFLSCAIIAGISGGVSVKLRIIIMIQALPALITLILLLVVGFVA